MDITQEIKHAKASAEQGLLKQSNVTGVGVGEKITKGVRSGKACIRVYVKKKLPKTRVAKGELIPERIDGIPTDVIEREFVLHPLSIALDDVKLMADAGTYDPLTGGISIGPCRAIGGSIFVGTLGLVVEDNTTGDPMMLSNFHVMCVDNSWSVGDTMAQPARAFDGGSCPSDVVGELSRAQIGGQVDGAVARITNRNHNCRIAQIGNVSGTATAVHGEAVRKRGRTTELTHGFVDDVSLSVTINYGAGVGNVTLTNQIGIEADTSQNAQFGINGDSGSVVVNASGEVIGLYFAGTDAGDFGVANPISSVFGALDVSLCQPAIGPTSVLNDTSPWSDQRGTHWETVWESVWETNPWGDQGGGSFNKNFDDVKNPAGYDTLMETINEGGGITLQEGAGTFQEGGGFDPGIVDPPGRFRGGGGGGGGGGAAPFSLSTPHHAVGARRFDGPRGPGGPGGGQDVDEEIEQVRQYLRALEARKRGQ